MSLGSISRETHEAVAIAMNRLGGNQIPEMWIQFGIDVVDGYSPTLPHLKGLQNGDTATSTIKQRSLETTHYSAADVWFLSCIFGVINLAGKVGCMLSEGPWVFVGLPNFVKAICLSESAGFAQLCEDEGFTFIGPPASAIMDMGDKSASKRIIDAAGVLLVCGYHGEGQDVDLMTSEAEKIGYPILIKPIHGRGGKAVDYHNAGTVEFLVDTSSGKFYFMEMNTRLQVEHSVTEMIIDEDLVEWQIRVANGELLPMSQSQVPLLVRVEAGVEQGGNVRMHCDPMIAKLVVRGENCATTLVKLKDYLSKFQVAGLPTNINFLFRLANHNAFENGEVETHFIEHFRDDLFFDPSNPVWAQKAHNAAKVSASMVAACIFEKENGALRERPPAFLDKIKEISEKKREDDDVLLAIAAGNRRPIIPYMEFEYPDSGIHKDLYQLIKYSCSEVCTTEQQDKVMKIWATFLEPMLWVSCRPQGADDTEDVIKGKNHISRSSAPSVGESDGSPLGGPTVVTTRESSPSRNRCSCLAWLVNGDKVVLMMEIILHVKVILYVTSPLGNVLSTSTVADETSRLSRQATSNEHLACSNSSRLLE
ncbi:methylcrotonyl-CoA carboxylase alpha chain [Actinidia rufa]|uniref:Methylcrotonyl-CoA carboxylase alpha chain n=1 Tax=Actinidia rufa TaxID=165716 RepID=A0A7J0EB68_9ERIC|nr:methylcrotonyl-CoA carboxylase alpha chain [Actinidia rufa]